MFQGALQSLRKNLSSQESQFLKRWPSQPKIILHGMPNLFMDEFAQRFSIDLGIPVVSVNQLYSNVVDNAGKHPAMQHRFFLRVKDILEAGDDDAIVREKIPLKLLRLTDTAQEGFILTDFPETV